MQYLGDYVEDYATLNFKFSTHKADGTPIALAGTPAVSVYKANGTTQSTAGITLTVDFDSVTGLNNVLIDLSADAFYAVSNDYQVVITTGTVDSVSVVGTVLAHFSVENRFNEVNVTAISGDSAAADNLESACDNYSATRGLAGTALPNAAADAAGGLPISDAGALDLDAKLAHTEEVTVARMGALTDWIDGGRLDLLIDALLTRLTATRAGYLDNLITAPPSASDIATAVWGAGTRTLSSFGSLVADTATAIWGAVARTITGGTVDTCTTNTDMRGTNSALLASGYTAPDNASITSIKGKTDQLTFTTANKVDATATVSTTGLATEANQTTIINHLTDVKGATFSGSTDSLEAIRDRGDVAWITGGTGGGSNAVAINVKASSVNVVDCYVEIWDSAGTSFISRTNTNSSGNVTFNLDSNTYIVKMHKTGYYFSNQTLIVDGAESVNYTGTVLTPTAPTDPTLCKVYGYYFDPSGNTLPDIKSMIKMSVAYESTDNNYYVESVSGTYNTTTGELSFNIVQGADAILDIPFLNIKKRFIVPAETLYKISDII